MALLNTLDAETTTQALTGWLAGRLSGAGDVEVSGVEIPPRRVPADDPPFSVTGWVLELSADARRKLCDNGLAVLAQVHAVDWKALGLEFLDEPSFGAPGIDWETGSPAMVVMEGIAKVTAPDGTVGHAFFERGSRRESLTRPGTED
jgi:hypothetical protein